MRFPEKGPKFEAHMDWHFRRNKQERQSEGRGSHRRWLPKAEVSTDCASQICGDVADLQDWINDISNAEAGPSSAPGGSTAAKGSEGSKPRLYVEQLQKRWVPVPSDPIKKARPCGICKEPFKDEWEEKEEIWIWKNAIEVDSKVGTGRFHVLCMADKRQYYHATCRAELLENRRLAKLKAEGEGRSMSKSKSPGAAGTPGPPEVKTEVPAPAPSGSSTGAQDEDAASVNAGKRKAEVEGEGGPSEETSEVKRVKVEQAESMPVHYDSSMQGQSTTAASTDDAKPPEEAAVQLSNDQSAA